MKTTSLIRFLCMAALTLLIASPAWGQGTLFVESDNVGIGVANPSDVLHIVRDTGSAIVRVITGGAAAEGNQAGFRFVTDAGGNRWDVRIGGSGNLIYNFNGGTVESTYLTNGNVNILGTLQEGSSREVKQAIQPVNPQDILAKVMTLPVATWSYNASPEVLHLGPMAEDFFEAFGVGSEPTSISTIDRDGVALAAIQGLKAEKDAELTALKAENQRLQEELDALRTLVQELAERQVD